MPFTVSHIAAVVPAHRLLSRRHLFTAAVIGSMVPDFGFLLPDAPTRPETHSLLGLFTFCLPVGLLTYWLTIVLVTPAVVQVAPDGAYVRLRAGELAGIPRNLRDGLPVVLTLLAAAITHLVWDAFTHENARGVRMFPVLDEYGPEINGYSIHLWRWLQYGSSIFGVIVVTAALIVWFRHAPSPSLPPQRRLRTSERNAWIGLYVALPLLAMTVALLRMHVAGAAPEPFGNILGVLAVDCMRASVVSLVSVSLLLRVRLALAGPVPPS
jgi:predicted secreted protein